MINENDLNEVLKGFLHYLVVTSNDEEGMESITELDIKSEVKETIRKECLEFMNIIKDEIETIKNTNGYSLFSAGIDFGLTRNSEGANFLDRDIDEDLKETLYLKSKDFSECHLYCGDDKNIYYYSYIKNKNKLKF